MALLLILTRRMPCVVHYSTEKLNVQGFHCRIRNIQLSMFNNKSYNASERTPVSFGPGVFFMSYLCLFLFYWSIHSDALTDDEDIIRIRDERLV